MQLCARAARRVVSEPIPRTEMRPRTMIYLDASNVLFFERDIPLQGEIHRRAIRLVTFYKADADDVPLIIFEEKSNALEPASVARPATGA